MVRLLVEDVTLHKTDSIHLHVRFRGGQTHSLVVAIPPTSWQARQTRPDTSPSSTDSSTPTPTPKPPTRSTSPVTARRRTNPSPPASSCTSAASTIYPATPIGSAPRACSPPLNSRNVSACTAAPSRTGPEPESSTPTRQTTRMNPSTSLVERASAVPQRTTPRAAPQGLRAEPGNEVRPLPHVIQTGECPRTGVAHRRVDHRAAP